MKAAATSGPIGGHAADTRPTILYYLRYLPVINTRDGRLLLDFRSINDAPLIIVCR